MKMNMKRARLCIVLGLLVSASVFAQSDLQNVAMINLVRQDPITLRMLKNEVSRMEKTMGRTLNATERRQVLDVMINERLALQAAERDKVSLSETELTQQLDAYRYQMAQQIGHQPDDREFAERVLQGTGLEMPAFREYLRRQLLTQKYLMSKKQDTIRNLVKEPTDEEVSYEFEVGETVFVQPRLLGFSMINVPFRPNDQAGKTRAKGIADRLAAEIGRDASKFDETAQRGKVRGAEFEAADSNILPRNGETRQIMGDDFIKIGFSMRQGEVSRVIEGVQGYHIIKVTQILGKKFLELRDEYPLGSRSTIKDYIKQSMYQQRQQIAVEQVSQELISELRAGNRSFQVFERNIVW
jgi:parvulin-like peptidyl-prolyl isomerase